MAHVPHLFVDAEWGTGEVLELGDQQRHHLEKVLRRTPGDPVTYTDGRGTVGDGTWTGEAVERGDERSVPEPSPKLTIAVAPPDAKDRVRWLVEKAVELGVWRIRWLRTTHGQGRIPRPDRSLGWTTGALEQSRGAWLTHVDAEWSTMNDLSEGWMAADRGGAVPVFGPEVTVAVGPEGGWAPDELPATVARLDLGRRVLRTETAVVALAAIAAVGGDPDAPRVLEADHSPW